MPIPFIAPNDEQTPFPAVSDALQEPNGLLMAGGSLSPARLLGAYSQGIFPWYEEDDPILWWSPDPRCILLPKDIRITRSLGKTIRSGRFEITENLAYGEVMKQCGAPRASSQGTWVTQAMIDAYCTLNKMGLARSLEVWMGHKLVGGLYGIVLGRVFIGESMFSRERDASKTAMVHLAQSGKYDVIDCQLETDHLCSMGAMSVRRQHYIELLNQHGQLDNYSPRADGSISIRSEVNGVETQHSA
ncbi:MAG: leucyl/phenylalanyl-tRNA--protein transferase [Gammaproteobacteria bacterium]|nr:leucyl/phenylalanyl-tRNA--protein transferase [Gammaproteobacteria bacterium]